MAENYDEKSQADDAALIERISASLRSSERVDLSFEERLMAKVRLVLRHAEIVGRFHRRITDCRSLAAAARTTARPTVNASRPRSSAAAG